MEIAYALSVGSGDWVAVSPIMNRTATYIEYVPQFFSG